MKESHKGLWLFFFLWDDYFSGKGLMSGHHFHRGSCTKILAENQLSVVGIVGPLEAQHDMEHDFVTFIAVFCPMSTVGLVGGPSDGWLCLTAHAGLMHEVEGLDTTLCSWMKFCRILGPYSWWQAGYFLLTVFFKNKISIVFLGKGIVAWIYQTWQLFLNSFKTELPKQMLPLKRIWI